jgi:glycosyltransferase involved in cell wall biosynthesis
MTLELNAATLFAVAAKIRRRRKVISMVEGDFNYLGATGSATVKVLLRRTIARFVDVFVANSAAATRYLTDTLQVPRDRVIEGWWLAGMPAGSAAADDGDARKGTSLDGPVFLAAGQLIPRKGMDLLLNAVARYRDEVGPCRLKLIGDGPERHALERQAKHLAILENVEFVGAVPHHQMSESLRSCDLFVFPTLCDLVGRVAVEALSVGTPVAVSCHSGAAGVLIHEGENGVVMNPRDPDSLLDALRRATEPDLYDRISKGAQASGATLTPEAAAANIARAIRRARSELRDSRPKR